MKPSKESIIAIQKHMLGSGVGWVDSTQVERAEKMNFKTTPANGMSLIRGGVIATPKYPEGMAIWCQFNDLGGQAHKMDFPIIFFPKGDCKAVAIQVYMHFNVMLGRDPWVDLGQKVRDQFINVCIDGRLPPVRECAAYVPPPPAPKKEDESSQKE